MHLWKNWLYMWLLAASLTAAQSANAQVPVPASADRAVEIIVRDVDGQPLEAITIQLVRSDGSSTQIHQTNAAGVVSTFVQPGSYLVQFIGSWNGKTFLPIEQQNAGAVPQNYEVAGGLGIYIDVGTEALPIHFVIANSEEDQLVPLYDLASSSEETPEPYLFDSPAIPAIGIMSAFQRPEISVEEPIAAQATFQAAAASANEGVSTEQNLLNERVQILRLDLDIDWFELAIIVVLSVIVSVLSTMFAVILLARQLGAPVNGD